MKYLVGDIGNTLTKISLCDSKFKIKKSYNIETKKLYLKKNQSLFLKKFVKKSINKNFLFSSVVPDVFRIIKSYFKKNNFKTIEIKELKIKNIIDLNIDNSCQLGSDRIANAIGAQEKSNKDCLIIDFGTATTFDIVSKNGKYNGGVIAPGVKSSIVNLNKSTASLPFFKLKIKAKSYGKNTKDALNAGFLWGYQGLINNIVKKITSSSKKEYKIILTGGYANLFKKYLIKKPLIDQNITIKGIIKIYKELLI